MANKKHSFASDVVMIAILMFLCTILINRVKRYVHLNKHSVIHELDTNIADIIILIQRQLGVVRQTISMLGINDPHTKLARSIRSLTDQLHDLERKYAHNAPSLAMLGPIGTASIVLKEQEIKDKLHYIALGINDACVSLLNKTQLGRDERKTITLEELVTINTALTKELRQTGHIHR